MKILRKKVGRVPLPVVVLVAGVGAYLLYKKFSGSSSAAPVSVPDSSGTSGVQYGDSGSGGGGSAGGSPTSTSPTSSGTGADYTGTGTTGGSTASPIFDTAQPGNPYGQGVAYVEPGIGDLPPGVLPVYSSPNTTTTSGALASNPAQGGHSL